LKKFKEEEFFAIARVLAINNNELMLADITLKR
jgi:hypothetical protein